MCWFENSHLEDWSYWLRGCRLDQVLTDVAMKLLVR